MVSLLSPTKIGGLTNTHVEQRKVAERRVSESLVCGFGFT
jgi:hypothetical protein